MCEAASDTAGTWVEVESTGPPIRGAVHSPVREPVPFEGWLELISVLNAGLGDQPVADREKG
jgi:hypothetical protein